MKIYHCQVHYTQRMILSFQLLKVIRPSLQSRKWDPKGEGSVIHKDCKRVTGILTKSIIGPKQLTPLVYHAWLFLKVLKEEVHWSCKIFESKLILGKRGLITLFVFIWHLRVYKAYPCRNLIKTNTHIWPMLCKKIRETSNASEAQGPKPTFLTPKPMAITFLAFLCYITLLILYNDQTGERECEF